MKQETLEEADKRFNIFEKGVLKPNRFDFICGFRDGAKFGAKWQQERSYSEDDMLESFMAGIKCESKYGKNFKQFIKQFKKK